MCEEGCNEIEMKRKRKLFKKSEKLVILLFSVVAALLFAQVLSLYSDKKAEVRATTELKVKSAKPVEDKGQRKQENPETIEKSLTKVEKEQPKQEKKSTKPTAPARKQKQSEKVDKPGETPVTVPPTKATTDTTNKKVAYLTIDDGPSNVEDEILDLLAAYNAKATFFMLEPNMRKYPDALKRIVNDGHAVGLHGVSHDAKKFYRSKGSVLNEMNTARQTLEQITDVRATLIRTPYGSSPRMTPAYKQAVAENGYKLWDWNVDSQDWKYTNGRFVQNAITQVQTVSSRGEAPIILIHSKPTTLKHLRGLLDYLVKQGYSLEPLNDTMEPYQLK